MVRSSRWWLRLGVPVLACSLMGCGAEPVDPVVREAAAQDLAVRPPSRGKVRGGEKMQRRVQWPDAQSRVLAAYDRLDAPSRAAVDLAPVPVLVPEPAEPFEEQRVMHGPEWAAFWGRQEGGVTISVHASRMARVLPGVRPMPGSHTLRGKEAFITRNEGIWAASWIEHGVAYDLSVECVPLEAPHCADSTMVEQLAEGLVYAGGRGEVDGEGGAR